MARQSVVDTVEAYLAAEWSVVPVFGENVEGETPEDGSPFIVLQYPYVTSRQVSLGAPGANIWRDDGAFRVVIHVERGSGVKVGRQWADEIADIFRGKDLGILQTWAPTAPVTDDRNPAATYYILSFSVPYTHDYFG
ncbi:phage tail terminator-like protein [Aliihoeflea sp. PC F10.4]